MTPFIRTEVKRYMIDGRLFPARSKEGGENSLASDTAGRLPLIARVRLYYPFRRYERPWRWWLGRLRVYRPLNEE